MNCLLTIAFVIAVIIFLICMMGTMYVEDKTGWIISSVISGVIMLVLGIWNLWPYISTLFSKKPELKRLDEIRPSLTESIKND